MTATSAYAANGQSAGRTALRESDPLTVRALARGLSILSLFDVDHREWTIDEIAARTGLLRMTAYRMVRTLEAAEFLVRDTTTNQYHLGPAAITMAYVAEDNSEFVEHARPFLEQLLEKTGESVTLAVPVDGVPVCVSIINSGRPFQRQVAPGRIIGDLASVHGKIFTAFAPPERRAAVLSQKRRSHTPRTVTDPAVLEQELARVAAEDVAFDEEGLFVSTCCHRVAGARPARQRRGRALRGHADRPLRPERARPLRPRRQGRSGLAVRVPRLEPIPAVSRVTSLNQPGELQRRRKDSD